MKFDLTKMKGSINKHAPEILLVTGIVGVVATAILAARGATKAADILAKKKEESETEEIEKVEVVKAYAEAYAPAVAAGIVTIGSIVGSHKISANRLASLANAYALADNSFKIYKEKVKEAIGEKKESNIRDEVVKERLAQNPVNNDVVVIGTGDVLCYDCLSGRYFRSTMNKVQKAVNDVNEVMKCDNYISLNELYDYLGLPHIDIGDDLGWSAGKYVEIRFSTIISTENAPTGEGVPCLALEYLIGPKYDYRDSY